MLIDCLVESPSWLCEGNLLLRTIRFLLERPACTCLVDELVENPKTDLYAKIAHGTGQNILREALLVADHNAYHIGQLVLLRQLLGAWKS